MIQAVVVPKKWSVPWDTRSAEQVAEEVREPSKVAYLENQIGLV